MPLHFADEWVNSVISGPRFVAGHSSGLQFQFKVIGLELKIISMVFACHSNPLQGSLGDRPWKAATSSNGRSSINPHNYAHRKWKISRDAKWDTAQVQWIHMLTCHEKRN